MTTFDPIIHDELTIDPDFPPTMAAFAIESYGEMMNGLIYVANGAGPHPTAILLHGYPGNEKNLDLAQAMRRAGWNVLFFHYRGSWGSGGSYSVMSAIEDVNAVIEFVLLAETEAQYRIDRSRLALVGHSMGGYLSLVVGSWRAEIGRICAIAPVHMRALHAQFVENPAMAQMMSTGLDATYALKGHDFAGNLETMSKNWMAYDFLWNSADFHNTDVCLIAASGDEILPPAVHHDPVVAALSEQPTTTLTTHLIDTDHAFSGQRIALMRLVIEWLNR